METILKQDNNQFSEILESIKAQSLEYLSVLDRRPTSVNLPLPDKTTLPENGLGTKNALADFNNRLEPAIIASSGPRYWGFVTGGTTPAAIAGDWLATVYDQNTQSPLGTGDVSARIELETIDLLLQLFGLPDSFHGGFVTGATMSNFTCLAVARQWIGKATDKDFAKDGIAGRINVLSATPHSSAIKSLSMLGIGSANLKMVKTLDGDREAIDIVHLEETIKGFDGEPFILISSGGTVNTVDFDDFESIAALKEKYKFWWHIDAAFGAFAAVSDKYKHLLSGWEYADSITVDAHKWLNVPYESAVFFVKKMHCQLQAETFQNSNAPYLAATDFNYLNFLPENSRRLKALPAWFTLMAYGKKGYAEIVDLSVAVARHFGQSIEESDAFELLAPVRLNTVCFSMVGDENQDKVATFLAAVNASGKVFMTPTVFKRRKGIRAAFVNWRTTIDDVSAVMALMNDIAEKITEPSKLIS